MIDHTFIRNCMPETTPKQFRKKHTKAFLEQLHPNVCFDDETFAWLECTSSNVEIPQVCYKQSLDLYYANSGVSLHHILIATQTVCVKCGSLSKPSSCNLNTVLVYTSIADEPGPGSVIPSRCSNKRCRHRGNYGWDVFSKDGKSTRLFQPQKDRHNMPYWVCSNQTVFVTSMITDEMLSQVLWNHAGSMTMANQGNWLLGHFDKLLHGERIPVDKKAKRKGIERRQLQRAFLEYLYHRTVISLGGNIELLSCVLSTRGKKPSLKDVVGPHLDQFINLFHDRWYRDHKQSKSEVKGHGIFEMYDGQWTMVRATCAADWCGVIDVGENRIRRSCTCREERVLFLMFEKPFNYETFRRS